MTTHGVCRLCQNTRVLVESHIFPSGVYKRFVSDQSKGGSFLNLKHGNARPKQFTRKWFCSDCERRLDENGEKYFFTLLDSGPHFANYEGALYYFAVSISWRCALFYFETEPGIQEVNASLECWRTYLLGASPTAEPYSQYFLSIQSAKWEHWNRSVGGFAMPNLNMAFTALGPFIILGVTKPNEFTDSDRAILAPAQLQHVGGKIQCDDSMTDLAYGVRHVKVAVDYWQTVSLNKLTQFEEK